MDVTADGSTLVVTGQIDVRCVAQLRQRLYDHLEDHAEPVVVDLSGVESVDLAVLRMLAVASRMANNQGHRLSVCGVPPRVRRLLLLTHLRGLILIEDDQRAVHTA